MPRPAPSSAIESPSARLKEIDPTKLAQIAQDLGTQLPSGLEAFLATYGDGKISGWVYLYPPDEILRSTGWLRGFFRDQIANGDWFWDRRGVLPPDRAVGSVHFGHTVGGDHLVFHPDDPDAIFALPRHSAKVHRIGRGLDEALDWLFLSGRLTRKMPRRVFLPHTERRVESWSIDLPYTKARRRLLALGIHDDVTEDDARQRNLELLVREIGGTVALNGPERDEVFVVVQKTVNGVKVPLDEPEPSDLILDCDPDCRSPKLMQFLDLAAELAGE